MKALSHTCSCGSKYVPEQLGRDGEHSVVCGCKRHYIFTVSGGYIVGFEQQKHVSLPDGPPTYLPLKEGEYCWYCKDVMRKDADGNIIPCPVPGCRYFAE